MKLLYHSISSTNNTSPFDEAILQISTKQPIKIICPYIGLNYLQRLIKNSSNWLLVSDVEEWLSAAKGEQRDVMSFITNHLGKIHHYPASHAKAVIGPQQAYLGSANLTKAGIQQRTELGMLVDNPTTVQELHHWFDALWSTTQSPAMTELEAYLKHLYEEAIRIPQASPEKPKISSKAVQIRAKLIELPISPESATSKTTELNRVDNPQQTISTLSDILEKFPDGIPLQQFIAFELQQNLEKPTYHARRLVREKLHGLCVNYPRSIFYSRNTEQLILTDGKLQKASPTNVLSAIAPYDKVLGVIFRNLSFNEINPLPNLEKLVKDVHLPLKNLQQFLSHLVKFEFILKVSHDCYQLNDAIEWPPNQHCHQFKQAGIAWDGALHRLNKSKNRLIEAIKAQQQVTKVCQSTRNIISLPADTSLTNNLVSLENNTPTSRKDILDRTSPKLIKNGKKKRLTSAGIDLLYEAIIELARSNQGFLPFTKEDLTIHLLNRISVPAQLVKNFITGISDPSGSCGCSREFPVFILKDTKDRSFLVAAPMTSENTKKMPRATAALIQSINEISISTDGHIFNLKNIRNYADKNAPRDQIYLEIAKSIHANNEIPKTRNAIEFFLYVCGIASILQTGYTNIISAFHHTEKILQITTSRKAIFRELFITALFSFKNINYNYAINVGIKDHYQSKINYPYNESIKFICESAKNGGFFKIFHNDLFGREFECSNK